MVMLIKYFFTKIYTPKFSYFSFPIIIRIKTIKIEALLWQKIKKKQQN